MKWGVNIQLSAQLCTLHVPTPCNFYSGMGYVNLAKNFSFVGNKGEKKLFKKHYRLLQTGDHIQVLQGSTETVCYCCYQALFTLNASQDLIPVSFVSYFATCSALGMTEQEQWSGILHRYDLHCQHFLKGIKAITYHLSLCQKYPVASRTHHLPPGHNLQVKIHVSDSDNHLSAIYSMCFL